MAAVETLEPSSALQELQTLTEISDDEVNLPPSDDEDEGEVKKELSSVPEQEAEEATGQAQDQQMNGAMVLSLLDKIIGAVDQIQQTQSGLESRQQEMERSVTSIQGELLKLAKSHTTTSNSVNKMMEKVHKVSVNVKTVRATLEKQGGQIKKLENNEAELLKRRNFKVMIYQDDVKIPSRLSISKSMKVSESVAGSRGGSLLELKEAVEEPGEEPTQSTDKPHVELSSDEDLDVEEVLEETRAERIKRSSLQRVQTLKTVFSKEKMDKTRAKTKDSLEKTKQKTKENIEKTKQKTKENLEKTKQKTKENLEKTKQKTKENLEKTRQKTKENLEKTRHNIEKKMGKLGTRMSVNPERKQKMQTSRDKVKKAFTPDHVVYARSKTAVYKVPPFTFHVKKFREGAVEVVQGTEMVEVSQDGEAFNGMDTEVQDGAVEVEMEMMNGGDQEEEHEEHEEHEEEAEEPDEEDSNHELQKDEDRDSD